MLGLLAALIGGLYTLVKVSDDAVKSRSFDLKTKRRNNAKADFMRLTNPTDSEYISASNLESIEDIKYDIEYIFGKDYFPNCNLENLQNCVFLDGHMCYGAKVIDIIRQIRLSKVGKIDSMDFSITNGIYAMPNSNGRRYLELLSCNLNAAGVNTWIIYYDEVCTWATLAQFSRFYEV